MELAEILEAVKEAIASLNISTSGLGVLVYVLQALALYTIAKRREIKKPWLAWVPVANVWILGSISDQYQYVVKRQVKNKRKVLLGLNIAMTALLVILVAALLWLVVSLIMMGVSLELFSSGNISMDNINPITLETLTDEVGILLLLCLSGLPLTVLAVIHTVYFYMALYDVFRSCDPKNSTLFIVLSIVGNFMIDGVYCVFSLLCMEKDLGMPPRKEESQVTVE